jgi:hypothetical protein
MFYRHKMVLLGGYKSATAATADPQRLIVPGFSSRPLPVVLQVASSSSFASKSTPAFLSVVLLSQPVSWPVVLSSSSVASSPPSLESSSVHSRARMPRLTHGDGTSFCRSRVKLHLPYSLVSTE